MPDGVTRIKELYDHKLARHILSALRVEPLQYKDLHYQVIVATEQPVHTKTLSATNQFLRKRRYVRKKRSGGITRYHITKIGIGYLEILEAIETMEQELQSMELEPDADE